jgi:hypothetical protein
MSVACVVYVASCVEISFFSAIGYCGCSCSVIPNRKRRDEKGDKKDGGKKCEINADRTDK